MLSSPNLLWQLWQPHTGSKWFPSMYTGFSSVKWCYLNPLLVPPALRHDPHNSAPTCARLPTRNSVKYRETNTGTVPNARRIQKWNRFTLVLGSRENNSGLSFVLIFLSFFQLSSSRKSITKGTISLHPSERRFAALSYFNFLTKSRGSSQFCPFYLHSFLRHKACPCLFCLKHGQNAASNQHITLSLDELHWVKYTIYYKNEKMVD